MGVLDGWVAKSIQSSCGSVVYFVFVMLVKQFAHAKGCSRAGGKSNDISILISLGVIVKCLPGEMQQWHEDTRHTLCHVDYGFNFGIYISFYWEADKRAADTAR